MQLQPSSQRAGHLASILTEADSSIADIVTLPAFRCGNRNSKPVIDTGQGTAFASPDWLIAQSIMPSSSSRFADIIKREIDFLRYLLQVGHKLGLRLETIKEAEVSKNTVDGHVRLTSDAPEAGEQLVNDVVERATAFHLRR